MRRGDAKSGRHARQCIQPIAAQRTSRTCGGSCQKLQEVRCTNKQRCRPAGAACCAVLSSRLSDRGCPKHHHLLKWCVLWPCVLWPSSAWSQSETLCTSPHKSARVEGVPRAPREQSPHPLHSTPCAFQVPSTPSTLNIISGHTDTHRLQEEQKESWPAPSRQLVRAQVARHPGSSWLQRCVCCV